MGRMDTFFYLLTPVLKSNLLSHLQFFHLLYSTSVHVHDSVYAVLYDKGTWAIIDNSS